MDSSQDDSVFNLITSLCEKFSNDLEVIKKLRSTCYEILLKKRTITPASDFKDISGPNPYCNLLAWQFTLSTKYGFSEHGQDIKNYGEYVRENFGDDIIQFLMCLRQVPVENDDSLDFELSQIFKSLSTQSSTARSKVVEPPLTSSVISYTTSDVWDLASKSSYSSRKNWEDFGHSEPDKEKPFLSELGDSSQLWVENLSSIYFSCMLQDQVPVKLQTKSVSDFIKDVKYLLVGMASYSFSYNKSGNFILLPNINVKGLTPSNMKTFTDEFIFCGACYKALHVMSTPNPHTGQYRQEGYIFAELCQSIQRYLEFYRTAITSLPNSVGLLKLYERTNQLRNHLKTLTSICKAGPYSESTQMPHGVSLLNYLYQTVLNLTDKNVLMVLYSILFPCCQVYFSRFLQQWLLDGLVNDPFEEFFIKPNYKYISTRGRTYWTRSYSLREDIVPDFLVDLRMDILNCGKAMNLLKLCVQSGKLCSYLMGKKPLIISCCLTSEQLSLLEQNATSYYLEILSECGPGISLQEIVKRSKEQDPIFMNLIAKKRAITLSRIELERKKILEEEKEKKLDEMLALKEQYDSAVQLKQSKVAAEIENEMKLIEFNLSVENKRDKLIEQEANRLIEYYNNLFEVSERRRRQVEKHIDKLKVTLEQTVNVDSNSSEESFYSLEEPKEDQFEDPLPESELHSSKSLDEINANKVEPNTFEMARKIKEKVLAEEMGIYITVPTQDCDNITEAQRNKLRVLNTTEVKSQPRKIFDEEITDLQKNRLKVLNTEFGIELKTPVRKIFDFETATGAERNKFKALRSEIGMELKTVKIFDFEHPTTDLQRNRLKVLNSEFGMEIKPRQMSKTALSQAEINRNHNMGSSDCFYGDSKLDNVNFLNRNVVTSDEDKKIKRSTSLSLDFVKVDVPMPMSVDSTPASDSTISRMHLSVEKGEFESLPTTAETQATDEGFIFDTVPNSVYIPRKSFADSQKYVFSKRVTPEEASGLSTNCLKLFLHESISTPLVTQTKIVNNELLKYFVNDLHYLDHLNSLRDYFFLQDGEFGRNITENLFEKLYDAHFPIELINCRTLKNLVFGALQMSNKFQQNSGCLSFKINSLPKRFHLGDPDVLDCLSLTYKVKWPLNILLPVDTIGKYDEVFKYLLKLNRISWVMKKIFLELKILAKISGKKEIYLMMSPHYRRLHQCRHVMLHFIQTLQNYVVGEVLQPSWEIFEKNLSSVTDLDSLYLVHTTYIKNILFLCLLNQKATPLRKVIQKIFVVILKFYDHLRSRSWKCENGTYVHPNFAKLESIYQNFEEFVLYLFKVGRKVAKSGYQPHLMQLLDMLDINGYYSNSVHVA